MKAMAEHSNRKSAAPAAPKAPAAVSGTKVGVVDSAKRAKTRRVVVNYLAKHPKYGKYRPRVQQRPDRAAGKGRTRGRSARVRPVR